MPTRGLVRSGPYRGTRPGGHRLPEPPEHRGPDLPTAGIPGPGGIGREGVAAASFVVEGMTCGGCAGSVAATVRRADPAARIEVTLDGGEVSVSGGHGDENALLRAPVADGWRARIVTA